MHIWSDVEHQTSSQHVWTCMCPKDLWKLDPKLLIVSIVSVLNSLFCSFCVECEQHFIKEEKRQVSLRRKISVRGSAPPARPCRWYCPTSTEIGRSPSHTGPPSSPPGQNNSTHCRPESRSPCRTCRVRSAPGTRRTPGTCCWNHLRSIW